MPWAGRIFVGHRGTQSAVTRVRVTRAGDHWQGGGDSRLSDKPVFGHLITHRSEPLSERLAICSTFRHGDGCGQSRVPPLSSLITPRSPGIPIMLRPVHFECVDFLAADIACDKGGIVGSEAKPGCELSVGQRSGFLKIHYLFNLSIAHP
jgi:hypothetical protein